MSVEADGDAGAQIGFGKGRKWGRDTSRKIRGRKEEAEKKWGKRNVDETANAQRRRAFLRAFPVCLGRFKQTPDSLVG